MVGCARPARLTGNEWQTPEVCRLALPWGVGESDQQKKHEVLIKRCGAFPRVITHHEYHNYIQYSHSEARVQILALNFTRIM